MKLLPLLLLLVPRIEAGRFVLLEEDSLEIGVGSYRAVHFALQEHEAVGAVLTGEMVLSPDTASVELLLLHQDDYARWVGGLSPVDTLSTARISGGPLRMDLPRFGLLVLVISNRGNLSPVRIRYRLEVLFEGPRSPNDPLPSALKLLLFLITGAVVVAVAGSVIVRERASRRRS